MKNGRQGQRSQMKIHRWRMEDKDKDHRWRWDERHIQKSSFQDIIWHWQFKMKIKKTTHFTINVLKKNIRTKFLLVILYIFVVMYINYAMQDIKTSKF